MATITDWSVTTSQALTDVTSRVINFIPNVVGAIVVLIAGWVVGALLEWAVESVLRAISLPTLFEKVKIEEIVRKTGSKKDTCGLIGSVVKWVVLIVAFIAAADILQLTPVRDFFNNVLGYIPSAVAAAAILLIGTILAHFMARVVEGSIKVSNLPFSTSAASITKYGILVFTVIIALSQLGIATAFLQTLFTGFVALIAIAGGLAFGLGGQEAAKDAISKIKREVEIGK